MIVVAPWHGFRFSPCGNVESPMFLDRFLVVKGNRPVIDIARQPSHGDPTVASGSESNLGMTTPFFVVLIVLAVKPRPGIFLGDLNANVLTG